MWLLLKEESFEACSVLSYWCWPLNATILNKWQLRLGKRAISHGELLYANGNKAVSLGEYPLCVYTETFSWALSALVKILGRGIFTRGIMRMWAVHAYNAMNWLGGTAIFLYMLASPLTYAVYHWSGHCECSLMQKQWRFFTLGIRRARKIIRR